MENQESTFELTLKLTLPANTLKKLKSYAMLSGMTVDELEKQLVSQVEPELSAHFDKVLTEGIVGKLSEMDGIELSVSSTSDKEDDEGSFTSSDDHQLSGDDDSTENKSLAEQYEAIKSSQKSTRQDQEPSFDIQVPDAGGDAEKFLDTALAEDAQNYKSARRDQGQGPYGSYTGAAKRFSPGSPRVKISEHTGDESGYFS